MVLEYELNMRKLFIQTGLISLIFGVIATIGANAWWIFLAAFIWLCGGSWVIDNIRHGLLVSELAEGIDILMGWEAPKPKEKDGSLKSWF
ncbi:hypothetical protein D0C36_19040 [Mucilaginibacter conchicola]|uniref:Uncharacterized protein n=1 Tax=Mucilaginibacter conchicola TaxID=2303333 RepID=A0A372NQX0_9SPHI|nr:hypothetical protein [Mucilaginibacter conchicola]RFZ91040.1 hypothetical protein D0C36_19040 [Mucilaginibacter conchicola]